MPTLIATGAVILGLKAVALAEDVAHGAQAAGDHAAQENTQDAQAPAENGQQCAPASFADQAGLSQAEVQVLQALGARRQALDARAGEVDTESALLSAAEQRLDQRLAELRRLESSVSTLLGQLDEQQAVRINNLVDVYQRMRAKDAAAVFDTLDEDTLVLVASRMRQQNLAEVMGRMDPLRARRLTQLLAELSRQTRDGAAVLAQSQPQPQQPARPAQN
ncbi:MAG: hypothetical protein ABW199_07115 [Caulobacterales bacterium]